MNGKIYEITNLLNGKRYFGQTTSKYASRRWAGHSHSARNDKRYPLYNSIRKYGIENFKFHVIIDNIATQDELDRLERVWIAQCNTIDRNEGYNVYAGGSNGTMSEETKRKISIAKKGKHGIKGIKRSPEAIENMRKGARSRKRPPPMSESQKLKIANGHRGKKYGPRKEPASEDFRRKLSIGAKRYWESDAGKKDRRRVLVAETEQKDT